MSMKISVACAVLCVISLCGGSENSTQELSPRNSSNETLETDSEEWLTDSKDLDKDASMWRFWRPFRNWDAESDTFSTFQPQTSTAQLTTDNESTGSGSGPVGTIENEITTSLFEAMLESIVVSWVTIQPSKKEESYHVLVGDKIPSESTILSKKKKTLSVRSSRSKRSRSKLDVTNQSIHSVRVPYRWPDEKAIIIFRNGNSYEGQISMKCMNGEGRFQWADGTVYLGTFKENEIRGKGQIQWKDDTWYQGEFLGNLRHGRGLFVDSRKQRSYAGEWHYGTKHGEGVIYYSKGFKNSYHGQWIHNERFGYGSREYNEGSGYKGEWERNIREGKGLMIWPNHDFYRGDWKNGVMSGYGVYIWDSCFNNTMSLPTTKAFRGSWYKGQRQGFGILDLGLDLSAYYKGEFKNNFKHGHGMFVTTNGVIIQHKKLFFEGNIGPFTSFIEDCPHTLDDPLNFDIYDGMVGLAYHVEQAIKNIDTEAENRNNIVEQYIKNNEKDVGEYIQDNEIEVGIQDNKIEVGECNKDTKIEVSEYIKDTKIEVGESIKDNKIEVGECIKDTKIEVNLNHDEDEPQNDEAANLSGSVEADSEILRNIISFEVISLRNALSLYETDLFNIYNKYATICNTEEIGFQPVLIRLFLWQLYYDCNIHAKGLTLVEIDNIFYKNSEWLLKTPHNPFEKVQYWQFVHSLISVASRLYSKREIPSKPDTMVATAFRIFMEKDLLPGSTRQRGSLVKDYGRFIPLKATYKLYCEIGEPHTIRDFLRAVRHPTHYSYWPQPSIVEAPDSSLPLGHNAYIFGDEFAFILDDGMPEDMEAPENVRNLKMFNFGNLSTMCIIKIFSKIFPGLCNENLIMNLEVKLSFFEYFEAFVECAKKSIFYSDKELINWRKRTSERNIESKVRHHPHHQHQNPHHQHHLK